MYGSIPARATAGVLIGSSGSDPYDLLREGFERLRADAHEHRRPAYLYLDGQASLRRAPAWVRDAAKGVEILFPNAASTSGGCSVLAFTSVLTGLSKAAPRAAGGTLVVVADTADVPAEAPRTTVADALTAEALRGWAAGWPAEDLQAGQVPHLPSGHVELLDQLLASGMSCWRSPQGQASLAAALAELDRGGWTDLRTSMGWLTARGMQRQHRVALLTGEALRTGAGQVSDEPQPA